MKIIRRKFEDDFLKTILKNRLSTEIVFFFSLNRTEIYFQGMFLLQFKKINKLKTERFITTNQKNPILK